jgi:hypothetical protein
VRENQVKRALQGGGISLGTMMLEFDTPGIPGSINASCSKDSPPGAKSNRIAAGMVARETNGKVMRESPAKR